MKKLALFTILALAMVSGAYNATHAPDNGMAGFDGPPCPPNLCPPPPAR